MPGGLIEVVGLGKSYGQVRALNDVSLEVAAGTVLGVLGHNGAGKTTLIEILCTRSRPTSGKATVCGWDVVRFGHHVRRNIGMTGQFVSVDESLSGRGNLVLLARLLGATRRQAKLRSDELIESFGLADAATRKVSTYSGGMRRRLDLAASLLSRPPVLFLDEPTTGLDPVGRTELWRLVRGFADSGTAIVLTTQYLEEADELADDVVVLGLGSVVARGSPAKLKQAAGQRTAALSFATGAIAGQAADVLATAGFAGQREELTKNVTVPLAKAGDIAALVRALDAAGIGIVDFSTSEPSLNDVYVALHKQGWSSS